MPRSSVSHLPNDNGPSRPGRTTKRSLPSGPTRPSSAVAPLAAAARSLSLISGGKIDTRSGVPGSSGASNARRPSTTSARA